MHTLADAVLQPKSWNLVTGLSLSAGYVIQNKTTSDIYMVVAPSEPGATKQGHKISSGDIHTFVKSVNNVYVYCGQLGGYLAIHEIHIPRNKDFFIRVAMGEVPGYSVGTVFGHNQDTDPGAEETVWDYGGIYTYLSADTELFLSSDDAGDTNVGVVVKGLTADHIQKTLVVTFTEGLSQQSIGNWFRIYSMANISGDAALGNVYVAESDTLTLGVPDTAAKVKALMSSGEHVTHNAIYTVPADHTLLVTRLLLGVRRNEDAVYKFLARGETYPAFLETSEYPIYQSTLFATFDPQFVISEKTDVEFRASTLTNNTQASINFGYVLVNNLLATE